MHKELEIYAIYTICYIYICYSASVTGFDTSQTFFHMSSIIFYSLYIDF